MVGWHAGGWDALAAPAVLLLAMATRAPSTDSRDAPSAPAESANVHPAVTGARKVPASRAAKAPAPMDASLPPVAKLPGHWIVRSASVKLAAACGFGVSARRSRGEPVV